MRVLMINAVCGIRSTGSICIELAKQLEAEGCEVKIAYGRESVPEQYEKYAVRIGGTLDVYWHALMSHCFDQRGYWSKKATRNFLKWAEEYNPDLLWIHNIHDYFINVEMLFEWIKTRSQMKVKWTQHDCWAFTGGCMHFIRKNCYQWKKQCVSCPKGRNKKIKRMERENFLRKKVAFTGVSQMTVVAVSHWIGDLIAESFLSEYPVEVVHNKIDRTVFMPMPGEFKKKYGLADKKVVLGVASAWNVSKGFYDFFELAKLLDDTYIVVLVGLNKKQQKEIPKSILGIPRVNSVQELVQIYSDADVFVNLTYEDTYPTVNLEAQACGTPCITYRTGGSVESVPKENIVDPGDLNTLIVRIKELTESCEL